MYQVEIDYSPAYDLVLSFFLYKKTPSSKVAGLLDIGGGWYKEVEANLSAPLKDKIVNLTDLEFFEHLNVLIWQCPVKSDLNKFLEWLGMLTPGELYEKIAPFADKNALSFQLEKQRNQFLEILLLWHEEYFQKKEHEILPIMKESERLWSEKLHSMSETDVIDHVANGLIIEPTTNLQKVILVPTIHYGPLYTDCHHENVIFVLYPARTMTESQGILNLTKALADESRLKILQLLSKEKNTFTEILKKLDLTKGSIHHHLLILKAAGLIQTHIACCNKNIYYSLRTTFSNTLKKNIDSFFDLN